MKSFLKIAALAGSAAVTSLVVTAPLHAQAAAPVAAPASGIALVDLQAAVANSAAYKAAQTQIQTTYKTQLAAAQTRQQSLQTEVAPMRAEIETLQKSNAPKATVDAKIAAFQAKVQAGQAELQRLALPFARPDAYVKEQIQAKLEGALKAAMTAKKVTIVLNPEAITYALSPLDLTADVITQLNALVPSVSITPPANWQPGQGDQAAAAGR